MSRASHTSRGETVKSFRNNGVATADANRGEVVCGSSEEVGVGENGDARGPAPLVRTGERRRVEADIDVALRRRPALDLRDDRELSGRRAGSERLGEPARRRHRAGRLDQAVEGAIVARGCITVCGDDLVEVRPRQGLLPRSKPIASSVRATTRTPTMNNENTQKPSSGRDSNNMANRNDNAVEATAASKREQGEAVEQPHPR